MTKHYWNSGQRQMVSLEPETAREVARRSPSIKAFRCSFAESDQLPAVSPETSEISTCIATKRLPQERLGGRCYSLWAWYHLASIHYRLGWSELRVLSLALRERGHPHQQKVGPGERTEMEFPLPGKFQLRANRSLVKVVWWLELQSTPLLSVAIAWLLPLLKPDTGLCWDPQTEDTVIEQPQQQLYNGCGIDGHREFPPSVCQGKADGVIPKDDSVQDLCTPPRNGPERYTSAGLCWLRSSELSASLLGTHWNQIHHKRINPRGFFLNKVNSPWGQYQPCGLVY